MSEAALSVTDLHAGYDGALVLRGVSMHARIDEIVSIIGPNGAGKSTFLKAVAGIVRPSSGSVVFDGVDVTGLRPDRLTHRGLGFVPQLDNVFPTLTVSENLHVGAQALPRRDRHDAIAAVVDQFSILRDRGRQRAGTLSGGQRKLLALALRRVNGVDVVEANDGVDGLRKLTSDTFQLAIVDINMPVMNGIQLIELARAEKKLAGIPILVITTEGAEEDRKRALAAGANGYLTKPVEPSKVSEAVKKLLEAA